MFRKYSPWHDAIINLAGLRSKMTIPGCWRCLSVSIRGSVGFCLVGFHELRLLANDLCKALKRIHQSPDLKSCQVRGCRRFGEEADREHLEGVVRWHIKCLLGKLKGSSTCTHSVFHLPFNKTDNQSYDFSFTIFAKRSIVRTKIHQSNKSNSNSEEAGVQAQSCQLHFHNISPWNWCCWWWVWPGLTWPFALAKGRAMRLWA